MGVNAQMERRAYRPDGKTGVNALVAPMVGAKPMRLTVPRAALALLWLCRAPARADPALDALVAAYPDFLAGYDEKDLIWKDGSRMPLSDGRTDKTFDELLGHPDIKD